MYHKKEKMQKLNKEISRGNENYETVILKNTNKQKRQQNFPNKTFSPPRN